MEWNPLELFDSGLGLFEEHRFIAADPVVPTRPRILQKIKQVPLSRARDRRRRIQDENGQIQGDDGGLQAENSYQNTPQSMLMEVPILNLDSLAFLNEYRRSLGLGASHNLMASAINNYDPVMVREYDTRKREESLDRQSRDRGDYMEQVRKEYRREVHKVVTAILFRPRRSNRGQSLSSISDLQPPTPRPFYYSEDPFFSRFAEMARVDFWDSLPRKSRFFPTGDDSSDSSDSSPLLSYCQIPSSNSGSPYSSTSYQSEHAYQMGDANGCNTNGDYMIADD
ncbi:hypothetical protein F5Y12DRAFT_711332 [Xylaria sp. FL1777]|nr:hypothetical protein F5Y12DRAFT_711332 [Xylaria sp. FL1777]